MSHLGPKVELYQPPRSRLEPAEVAHRRDMQQDERKHILKYLAYLHILSVGWVAAKSTIWRVQQTGSRLINAQELILGAATRSH